MSIFSTLRFILQHPFNRNARVRALSRFVRWQVGSRLVESPVAVPYVNGTSLLVSRGMTGATGNIYVGLHEFEDMAFVGHYLRPGDTFIDVGANIGAYSILAASCGASVIAYEPIASSFRAFDSNIRLNGFEERILARRTGVGEAKGVLNFTTTLDTVNHVAIGSEKGEAVAVVRLDDESLTGERCLMKVDVEGFEAQVINGARTLMKSGHMAAVVVELNGSGARYGVSDDDVDGLMRSLGFASYAYDVSARTLRPATRSSEGNTLYVSELAHVAERVRTAVPLRVLGKEV